MLRMLALAGILVAGGLLADVVHRFTGMKDGPVLGVSPVNTPGPTGSLTPTPTSTPAGGGAIVEPKGEPTATPKNDPSATPEPTKSGEAPPAATNEPKNGGKEVDFTGVDETVYAGAKNWKGEIYPPHIGEQSVSAREYPDMIGSFQAGLDEPPYADGSCAMTLLSCKGDTGIYGTAAHCLAKSILEGKRSVQVVTSKEFDPTKRLAQKREMKPHFNPDYARSRQAGGHQHQNDVAFLEGKGDCSKTPAIPMCQDADLARVRASPKDFRLVADALRLHQPLTVVPSAAEPQDHETGIRTTVPQPKNEYREKNPNMVIGMSAGDSGTGLFLVDLKASQNGKPVACWVGPYSGRGSGTDVVAFSERLGFCKACRNAWAKQKLAELGGGGRAQAVAGAQPHVRQDGIARQPASHARGVTRSSTH